MNIIIQYDSSTANAPAGFFTAVQTAVNRADALIANNLTVTINFGWGEVAGQPVTGVGASITLRQFYPYAAVRAALQANEATLDDYASVNSLPLNDPTFGRGIDVSNAQALTLGLASSFSAAPVAGSIGLSSTTAFTFTQTATPGAYDAIGALYHEISEVLGRISDLGRSSDLTILDLFRYSAPGIHTTSTAGAYFSADGTTLIAPFNNPALGGDAGDWSPATIGDAFAEAGAPGVVNTIAMPDLRELDVLGYRLSTPIETAVYPQAGSTTVSTAPLVSIFFSELVAAAQGNLVIHRASDGSVVESVAINDTSHIVNSNGVITAYLPFYLDFATRYYVTLDSGAVTDNLGYSFIGLGGNASYSFTTPTALNEVSFWFVSVLRSPTAASVIATGNQLIAGLVAGTTSQPTALQTLIHTAESTTSVATMAYEFFTGTVPSSGGMDFLVAPTGPNPNNLNSAYYQSFNIENHYINFAVNLGRFGAGQAAFSTAYGSLDLFHATQKAYGVVFGITPSDAKVHALLDPTLTLGDVTMTRADYFAIYGGDGANGIGTKAAMVGWLLAEAVLADVGSYAKSNDAFLDDVALHNASYLVDMIGHYNQPSYAFNGG